MLAEYAQGLELDLNTHVKQGNLMHLPVTPSLRKFETGAFWHLELELLMVVSFLGTKPRSSTRVASVLNG